LFWLLDLLFRIDYFVVWILYFLFGHFLFSFIISKKFLHFDPRVLFVLLIFFDFFDRYFFFLFQLIDHIHWWSPLRAKRHRLSIFHTDSIQSIFLLLVFLFK